jgi:hypothetical protein
MSTTFLNIINKLLLLINNNSMLTTIIMIVNNKKISLNINYQIINIQRYFALNYSSVLSSGLIVGNNKTSRIDSASVNSITRRSIPIPNPPVGGIPYSKAST